MPALVAAGKVLGLVGAALSLFVGAHTAGVNRAVNRMRADTERRLKRPLTAQEWSLLRPQYQEFQAKEILRRKKTLNPFD